MKRTNLFFLFLLFSFAACRNKGKQPPSKSENHIDAARKFIRAALDGKFAEATTYMLTDSVNTNYMDLAERSYERLDQTTKDGYRTSTIRIIDATTQLNDSTTVLIYSNTFKNDPDTLKVIKINGDWLVDFKYLYLHSSDTLHPKELMNDKIK